MEKTETFLCKRCALRDILGDNSKTKFLTDDERFRKGQIDQFITEVDYGKKCLGVLMERQIHIKDRISKFYRNEFTKISTIFGDLLTKFQDVYNRLFNKVLETHKENKSKVIDFGDQLLDLKGDV